MGIEFDSLGQIKTVADMALAFRSEERCRRLFEQMVWPRGRLCPTCGCRKSTALKGRDYGGRCRPGLFQCANPDCRHQFTVTTKTPLHATKLPLRIWLTGMWLILQSDKGISSTRLAEMLGVSQPTAWRMGHAVRLMLTQEQQLGGIVETDEFYIGGRQRQDRNSPKPGRGRKGLPKTTKSLALCVVQRPMDMSPGGAAGSVKARLIDDRSARAIGDVLENHVNLGSHLMSDEWGVFQKIGHNFTAHDAVGHSRGDFARGMVHVNGAEGFNDRVRRTAIGVFHHISTAHADLYFNEIAFRWSQRTVASQAVRHTRKGRARVRTLWNRIPAAMQLPAALQSIVGRQLRRTQHGGISIRCAVAVFG